MRWIKKSASTQHIAKYQDSCLLCSITLSVYNAFVLYKLRPPVVPGINITSRARFRFLCSLGEQLIKPNMLNSAQYPNGLNATTVRTLEAHSVAIGP